jgi:putative ABC transport system permease protein
MQGLIQDLRYGVRTLWKERGFTAITILILAIGIGASTTVFTLASAILLKPLPYKDPSRLTILWSGTGLSPVSHADFIDWKNRNEVFEYLAAFDGTSLNLTGENQPEQLLGLGVSAELFPLLGGSPSIGRTFTPDEDQPGRNQVVILSDQLWRRRFNSGSVIGRSIRLNGALYSIIGVMPPEFHFPTRDAELWLPLSVINSNSQDRANRSLKVVGRLKKDVSLAQAQAQMNFITARLQEAFPETNKNVTAVVSPLAEFFISLTNIRPMLLMLLGGAALFLLIACANVANLLLAHGIAQRSEMAIRSAMGASSFRLVRQLLTKSMLIGLAGGVLGLGLATGITSYLVQQLPGQSSLALLPQLGQITVDWRVLSLNVAVSLLTGIIFGLAPAFESLRLNLLGLLKDSARASSGIAPRFQNALVVIEVALALVLLISGCLMIKSFIHLNSPNSATRAKNVLTMWVSLPPDIYPDPRKQSEFYREALENIATAPGVKTASAVAFLPRSGAWQTSQFTIEGREVAPNQDLPLAIRTIISPHYFETITIPLIRGRDFDGRDNLHAPGVAIVNEVAAQKYWLNENPLGVRIRFGASDSKDQWLTVVGVVKAIDFVDDETRPEIFVPYQQQPIETMTLAVRTLDDPNALTDAILQKIWSVDRNQPVFQIATLDKVISDSFWAQRLVIKILLAFTSMALILATVGVYAITAYVANQKIHDIGIRIALGATPKRILGHMLKGSLRLVAVGLGIGLILSFTLTHLLSAILYGITPTDSLSFVIGICGLGVIALIASCVPAYRASLTDPLKALRHK